MLQKNFNGHWTISFPGIREKDDNDHEKCEAFAFSFVQRVNCLL